MVYTVFRGKVVQLSLGDDGLYRDDGGTVFALRDDSTADPVDRCGVYPAVLPFKIPIDKDCAVHDFMYSSKAYQLFHTREEADAELRDLIASDPSLWRFVAWPFWFLARVFGGKYWENKKNE